MDDSVKPFALALAAEVEEAVDSPDAATKSTREMFTRLILERLEDAGHFEATFDLHQSGWFSNAVYEIDGYAIDEERGSLDLFTTIHTGEVPSPRVLTTDMTRAAERSALRTGGDEWTGRQARTFEH